MATLPAYRLYSGTTSFYFPADGDLTKSIDKELTDFSIPYSPDVYLIDEQTPVPTLTIKAMVGIGSNLHYSTDALFETAVANILAVTGGVYLDAGTYDTASGTFTSNSALPYRIMTGKMLIRNITYRRTSDAYSRFDTTITLVIGTQVI